MLLHIAIILGVIPFGMVWGGRLKDTSQMLSFEAVSVAVNLVMLAVVSIHAGHLKASINLRVLQVALWAMTVIFLLNTVGNALSNNTVEKLLFTPLTLLLSLFSLRLAMTKHAERVY